MRTLVLTHQVPALAPGDEGTRAEAAARHFAGEVVVERDLATITT